MKTSFTFAFVALPIAVAAFFLSRVIWPDPADTMMVPTSAQLPFFIFLGILEALAFGYGVAFLIFGWPHVRRIMGNDKMSAVLSFTTITWGLISWWPHDNIHRVNGMDMAGLLKIEYAFHFTLILSAAVLAYYFYKRVSQNAGTV